MDANDEGPGELDGVPLRHGFRPGRGVRLHTVEAGPEGGPPVLLLHGFPDLWWGWRHQVAPLARAGFRVVAPDLRGYGTSDRPRGAAAYDLDLLADDVVALADSLGADRVSLVGHDWGGIVAWWVAAREPGRVARLAVLNAPHPSAFGPYVRRHPAQALRSWYAGFFQVPRLPEALLSARGFAALGAAMTRSAMPGTFGPRDLAIYRRAWARPGAVGAMLDWYRALARRNPAAGREARIAAPTLLAWGVRDVALQRGLAGASLALCDAPAAPPLWLPHATHWAHMERPEAVNAALVAHLRPG